MIGEKTKSCVVIAVGALLYLVESLFDAGGTAVILGFGVFLATHAVVLGVKCAVMLGKACTDQSMAKLLKFFTVATLLVGLLAVCCVYASGKAYDTDWQPYVKGVVIGGLSAILHLVSWGKIGRRRESDVVDMGVEKESSPTLGGTE